MFSKPGTQVLKKHQQFYTIIDSIVNVACLGSVQRMVVNKADFRVIVWKDLKVKLRNLDSRNQSTFE